MLTAPPEYEPALHGPHRRVSYLTATDIDGVVLADRIPISTGTVRANLTNRVTRTATFTTPEEFYPDDPGDPLSPYLSVVHIRSGLALGNGLEITFPVFTGRIYTATLTAAGVATFRADDLAADVVAARFEQPMASSRSRFATQLTEVQRLILDAVPQATFGTNDVPPAPVPELVWDEDRGKALDDLSEAMGARWYALGDGSFVVRRFAYEPGAPVQSFLDGPQGLMSGASITRTRDGSANSVVIVSERLDGTEPVRVVRRDTSASSPTRYGGKFGRVVQVIKVQTPQTQNEANLFGVAQLTAAVALTEQWSATVVADHRIEPGDTVRLRYRGRMADQIIDAVTYPLGTGPMTFSTRGTVQLTTLGA